MQLRHLRRRFFASSVDQSFGLLARLGALTPLNRPDRYGVERSRSIAYGDAPEHVLDVYTPQAPAEGPRPVALYLHGGGFRSLSKDTHWYMALRFARHGLLTYNADYRLAPAHRYPAAIEDAARAFVWMVNDLRARGGDPDRVLISGESAGANLALALTAATLWERPEPWAQAVYALGVVPRVVIPACGILQVSDTARFGRRKKINFFLQDCLDDVGAQYLPPDPHPHDLGLADPLVLIEGAARPDRPLPAVFLPVGTGDALLDDSRRAEAAWRRLGGHAQARYYPGEIHAFHGLIWRKAARDCWAEMLAFTDQHLRRPDAPAAETAP